MAENVITQPTSRTTEFVLGLLGGIFGFFGGISAFIFGGIGQSFGLGGEVIGLGAAAMIFALIGISGASLVKIKPKIAGILMLVSAVGGLISISLFYILPAVLLLIAGLMAIIRKELININYLTEVKMAEEQKQTPPVSPPPTQPVAKKGMSTGAKVGIGIGGGCFLIIIIIIIVAVAGVGKGVQKVDEEIKKEETKQEETKKFKIDDIYAQIQTGMTEDQVKAIVTKEPLNCTESEMQGIGTSKLCTYGNVFTDSGSIMVTYMNGTVSSKTKSQY